MTRFARPPLAIPKIPTPPKVLVLPRFVLLIAALKNAIPVFRGFSLGSFLSVNPLLVQIKAQEAVVKENLLKAKMRIKAAIPVPPVPPPLLQIDLAALQEYRAQTEAMFNQAQMAVGQVQSAASQAQAAVGQAQAAAQAAVGQVTG